MQWWVVQRQVHTSWLIAIGSVALLCGVVCAKYIIYEAGLAWIVVCLIVIGVCLWKRYFYLIPVLIIACIAVGWWRGSVDAQQLTMYSGLYGHMVTIEGTVSEDADIDKTGALVLRLSHIKADEYSLHGMVWVSAQTKYDIKRGDIVAVKGTVLKGFGTFAAAMYRAQVSGVERPQPGDVARRVRDWFADAVRVSIPDPQASLGIGYLVGQRRALPEELAEALKIAGLTHIVVASGYNLTILVRLTRRLFVRISKYLSTLCAAGMIMSFVAVTGASPSMSRAGLVCGLSLAAWYYGRTFHPIVLLCFAAAVTVMLQPSYAWGDMGWQLSFAAFAGVMIVAPILQAYFFGEHAPGTIRQILGETISAHIVTLPILLYAFGQMSNVAILSNILVLPFVPLAMLLTFIAGIAGVLIPSIGPIIGLPANLLLHYMVSVAEYVSKLSWAQSTVEITIWIVIVSYIAIGAACYWMARASGAKLRQTSVVE